MGLHLKCSFFFWQYQEIDLNSLIVTPEVIHFRYRSIAGRRFSLIMSWNYFSVF